MPLLLLRKVCMSLSIIGWSIEVCMKPFMLERFEQLIYYSLYGKKQKKIIYFDFFQPPMWYFDHSFLTICISKNYKIIFFWKYFLMILVTAVPYHKSQNILVIIVKFTNFHIKNQIRITFFEMERVHFFLLPQFFWYRRGKCV